MTGARVHPALAAAAAAAQESWAAAIRRHDRHALIEAVAAGADGTPTSRLDAIVEEAILRSLEPHRVNVLSEEAGFIDNGSPTTIVIDPVDGTGNAAAGVPFSAFTGAVAIEDRFVEGLTEWLDTGRRWWGRVDEPSPFRTSGRTRLDGAMISMIRPKNDPRGFLAVAGRADRVRTLGSSSIEAALVASGAFDASLDAGSRTHRIVDIAAAVVLVGGAGGVVVDGDGRAVEFTTDIERRWSGVIAATAELAAEIVEVLAPVTAAPPMSQELTSPADRGSRR